MDFPTVSQIGKKCYTTSDDGVIVTCDRCNRAEIKEYILHSNIVLCMICHDHFTKKIKANKLGCYIYPSQPHRDEVIVEYRSKMMNSSYFQPTKKSCIVS